VLPVAGGDEPVCGFFPPVREYVHEKTVYDGSKHIGGDDAAGRVCQLTADVNI
jgi:hypothetical protein